MPEGFSEKMRKIVTGRKLKEATKSNISKSLTGREFTEEHKSNISKNHADVAGEKNPFFGKTHSNEQREKWKESRAGKVWITNGSRDRLIGKDEVDIFINNGWTKGRGNKNGA